MLKTTAARWPQRFSGARFRWVAVSVLMLAAIVTAVAAHAQGRGGLGMSGPGGGMMMFGGSPERIGRVVDQDRKSTRLNSSHLRLSRMPSSA